MATGGTIQYGIKFNVDSTGLNQVKQELKAIQDLTTTQFQQMNPNASKNMGQARDELVAIKKEALEIEKIFNKSYNIKLNTTNINQVKKDLANMGLDKIYNTLSKLGPQGTATFQRMAASITMVQTPLKETNKLLDKLAESFGNTVRWGITSSVWNNITGSIQKAWNYTKNLDSSLNDIRVVTGQSADQMERLARNANKTAQALGNTTLDYTKAALIYYQQGLSDAEVEARTDVTLKLANVLNTSAQEVSDYMTAIWNNFAKGTETLEHYADVITALGAATAASSEEIATGLEKFAAVANTVGLSYEYATTALATVVAQTRQSADTVGTAFKTLFARIQDLELGKTLDDGTTLGKYAEALQKVGISIKDSSGELKNMDTILSEMGSKWNTLTKAQQVALAQNVAGTRQYTQLVALMDNWDKFGINLEVAANSAGTLQKQQEIYMESTEAHLNKLQASFERLMDTFVDNKAINSLIDGLTSLVNLFNSFIESIGGAGPALALFATTAMRIFSTKIAQGITKAGSKIQAIKTELTEKDNKISVSGMIDDLVTKSTKDKNGRIDSGTQNVLDQLKDIDNVWKSLDETQQETLKHAVEGLIDATQKQSEYKQELESSIDFANKLRDIMVEEDGTKHRHVTSEKYKSTNFDNVDNKNLNSIINSTGNFKNNITESMQYLNYGFTKSDFAKGEMEDSLKTYFQNIKNEWEKIKEIANDAMDPSEVAEMNKLIGSLDENNPNNVIEENGKLKVNSQVTDTLQKMQELKTVVDPVAEKAEKVQNILWNQVFNKDKTQLFTDSVKASGEAISNVVKEGQKIDATKTFINISAAITQCIIGIQSLTNLTKIWGNETLSTGEKVSQTLTGLTSAVISLLSGWKAVKEVLPAVKAAILAIPGWGWALAAVAAITAITAAVIIWNSEQNKINREIERTKNALEEANKKVQELETNIKNYDQAQDSIKQLTENTIEFYNAIIKANEESQKLIDSLNLIAGKDYTIDANGLIKINETSLETKQYAALQESYRAQAVNFEAQLKQNDYNQRQLIKNFTNAVNSNHREETDARLSTEQGKQILLNEHAFRGAGYTSSYLFELDNINTIRKKSQGDLNRNNKYVTEQIDQIIPEIEKSTKNSEEAINLQKEITTYLPEMRKLQQEQIQLERQRKLTTLYGYATQSQQAFLRRQTTDTAANIEELAEKYQPTFENPYQMSTDEIYTGKALREPIFEPWKLLLQGQGQQYANMRGVKEAYLVNTNQYTQEQIDKIYKDDQYGKYADLMDSVNIDTALDAWNNNRFDLAETSLNDFVDLYKKYEQALNADPNRSATSTKYILDALSKLQTEKLTVEDINKLTENEKQNLRAQIDSGYEGVESFGKANIFGVNDITIYKDVWDALFTKTEEGYKSVERLREEHVDYINTLSNAAEQLGTTTEALDFYAYAIANANGALQEFNAESAEAAVELYKFNKTYNEARSTFSKNSEGFEQAIKDLKNMKIPSQEAADAVGQVLSSLKNIGIYIKASDLTDNNIISKINKLLKGTEEEAKKAYEDLYDLSRVNALAEIFNINIDDDNFKDYKKKFEDIVKAIDEAEPGANLEKKFATQLGQMITDYQLTGKQINQLSEALGVEIPVELAYDKENFNIENVKFTTAAQSVLHKYSGDMMAPDGQGGLVKVPVDYQWIETVDAREDNFVLPEGMDINVKTNKRNIGGKISTSVNTSTTKNKTKNKEAKTKGEADRYHEVNTQIAKVNAELSKLEKQSQKTLGGDLLKNLNKQWQDLNKQAQNYNEKLRIARDEQEEVRKKLQKLGLGVKFNADGTVSNYVETYNKALKQLNAAEDKYDKKQSEANRKKVEKLKTQFEDLQKYMDRNDELISSFIPDIYAQAQEAMDKQVETNLKEFRAGIALAVDIKDLRVNWNDFKAKFIEDLQDSDVLGNVALDRANTAEVQKLIGDRTKQLNAAVSELSRNAAHLQNLTGDDLVKAIEEAKTNYEDLMKDYQELVELRNHAKELYKQALEDEKQAIQDQLDLYNKINDQLEKDKKLVELTYGDKAYDKLVKYSKLQDANNKEILKADVEAEKTAKRRYEEAQQMYQDGKLQAEDLKNAETDLLEASARVTDDLNNSLEHLQDTLKTTADAIAKAYSQDVSGAAGGLDFAQEEWDLINKHADQYLDTINRLTGENQLESKYLESIEKATSPAIQKKLKDAMDSEMKSLREKDKLSQYDLDRANKKYQVTLAQIALEEAQDNKSQMRLRRDSQGNYRYQYVADETQVNAAEEGLRTALADLYNFDKDRLKTTYNDILAIEKEYNQKRAEILADPNLSPEERLEKERLLHEQYEGPDGLITNAYALGADARANVMDSAFEDLAYLQEKNKDDFINMTDAEQDAIMTGLIPAWDSLAAKMAEVGANVDAQQQYWQDAKDALVDYQNAMAEDLNITGKDTEDIANATDSDLDFIEGLIKPMSEVLNEQNNIVEGARNWYIEISNIKDGLTPVVKALQNAKDTIDAIDSKKLQEIGIATGYNRTDATLDEFMNGGSQGGGNNNANVANLPSNPGQAHPYGLISDFEGTISSKSSAKAIKAVQYALQQLGYDIGASGVDGKLGAKTKAAITAFQKANGGSDNGGKVGPKTKEWFRLKGFDTGGYTGTWDDNNGRLAFLHQKELVLNSEDTKNILAATRTIRQAMVAKQDSLISAGVTPMGNDILEQNVHIEATFPNATSANEIEEALRNLVNAAAQRRRKI